MRRLLLTLVWLPCVIFAAAWPAAYWWRAGGGAGGWLVDVLHGAVYVAGPDVSESPGPVWFGRIPRTLPPVESAAGLAPARWLPVRLFHIGTRTPLAVAVVPLWVPTLALAVPAAWLTRRQRRRRYPSLCLTCGYDLRASPDRCPERLC